VVELGYSGMVVNFFTTRGKEDMTCPWRCVTQIFRYLSQLIRYSELAVPVMNFVDRGLLLTRKLLNQGFLVVRFQSSLLLAHSCVQHILYCVFVCFSSSMLQVSLLCPVLISSSVFSNVYLEVMTGT
jgi:hypothetical protein